MRLPLATARAAVWLAVAVLPGLAACGEAEPLPEPDPDEVAPAPEVATGQVDADAALSLERLQSATYYLPRYGDDPIRMRFGEFADEAAERYATFVEAPILQADLDGDGEVEVAATVAIRSGMQLVTNLVAMQAVGGRATQRAVIELGPGVVVNGMRLEGRRLVLDVLRIPAGPGGRPRNETRGFLLEGGTWIEVGGREQ